MMTETTERRLPFFASVASMCAYGFLAWHFERAEPRTIRELWTIGAASGVTLMGFIVGAQALISAFDGPFAKMLRELDLDRIIQERARSAVRANFALFVLSSAGIVLPFARIGKASEYVFGGIWWATAAYVLVATAWSYSLFAKTLLRRAERTSSKESPPLKVQPDSEATDPEFDEPS